VQVESAGGFGTQMGKTKRRGQYPVENKENNRQRQQRAHNLKVHE
jgi:UDP-N-acetylglucosamine pyrophosphorylase